MVSFESSRQRVFCVHVRLPGEDPALVIQDAEELQGLVEAIGWEIAGSSHAMLKTPNASLLLGSGKVDETRQLAFEANAAVILVDHTLSPSQQRNWEEICGISVTDRQGIILEIFADRAQTREAQLQVELAQLRWTLPRLASSYTNLSRQRGGTKASRGAGETQIELDRRVISDRIRKLGGMLDDVRLQRDVLRKQRVAQGAPSVALVGYTNAGKSSIHRVLSGNDTYVANALFATLDPTARQCKLASGQICVVIDTVGFIRKLPHGLIEAFKATLEESVQADVLLHVVDASNPHAFQQYLASMQVLEEIGAKDKPMLVALNKCDVAPNVQALEQALEDSGVRQIVKVSAMEQSGFEQLQTELEQLLHAGTQEVHMQIPFHDGKTLPWLYSQGCVLSEEHGSNAVHVVLRIDQEQRLRLESAGFILQAR